MPRALPLLVILAACGPSKRLPVASPAAKPPPSEAPIEAPAAPPAVEDAPAQAPLVATTTGLTPADTDRLQGPAEINLGALEDSFQAVLTKAGIPLQAKTYTDSIDGDDPVPEFEHPSKKTAFRIGPCSPVEAWWLFATYNDISWFPRPDASALPWQPGEKAGEQVATIENPNKAKHLWVHELQVVRMQDTGRVTMLQYYERGEGWGNTRFMRRLDDTTWVLEDVIFAD